MQPMYPTDTIEHYAAALRAIGQDLAGLLPLSLEIDVDNGRFNVRGRGLVKRSQEMDSVIENFLHKVWNMLIRRDPAADIVQWLLCSEPFARTYTQQDIKRWNESSSSKRKGGTGMPDIYSLGERLRVVGKMVDAKQSDLISLSKSVDSVSFQYLDKHGHIHLEEFSADNLYRIQQQYYADRKTAKPFDASTAKEPKTTRAA